MSVGIEVRDLSFSYGGTESAPLQIKNFSYSFEAGKVTGVLGHNGCGKSTLIKNILGYLKPLQGEILFADQKSSDLTLKEKSRLVSLVPQKLESAQLISVIELVKMGRLPYLENRWTGFSKKDRDLAMSVLKSLRLDHFADKSFAQLSGGEQQKIIIARSLVQETPIVLLDEATANLDMNHSVEIMSMIRSRVQETGMTAIAVMHDLNMAAQYCDNLVLMAQGEILCSGSPQEVLQSQYLKKAYGIALEVHHDAKGVPFILPGRSIA